MIQWSAYKRLTRLDKPIGILLLWYPTAWALWLVNKGTPSLRLLFLFFAGTVIMRSAGCVINDIADKELDKYVKRTNRRPLATGEITVTEALIIVFALLVAALIILINLPWDCIYFALISLVIVIAYPFCKRFISAPQTVLGLAFSVGIPMAYVASGVTLTFETLLLFFINFFWIVAYDTMYAMTDKEDDLKVGIKSTAIYFGHYDLIIITGLQITHHALWLLWSLSTPINNFFYLFWIASGLVLFYQHQLISQRAPEHCFKAFLVSNYYGALMWLAVYTAYWGNK